MTGGVRVRGGPTPEELAAVLAALSRDRPPPSAYEQWRATRLAALRRAPDARGGAPPAR
jgi:N-acyl-L-homoserine lactone synthetase